MSARPLVIITLAFAAGIAAAYLSLWPLDLLGLFVGLAGAGLALGGVLWDRCRPGEEKGSPRSPGNAGAAAYPARWGLASVGLTGAPRETKEQRGRRPQ